MGILSHALLSTPSSLAALSVTCRETQGVATKELSDVHAEWLKWLSNAPTPLDVAKIYADAIALRLDEPMLVFVLDEQTRETVFQQLDGKDRKWLHCRAEQLGLTTTTKQRRKAKKHSMASTGDVVVCKPPQWEMKFDAPPKASSRHATACQHGVNPFGGRRARMETWSRECDECGATLDAYDALYHHSGMGPLCQDCVDADPELEGLKWEAKADFW
jgi:hypothetical protein